MASYVSTGDTVRIKVVFRHLDPEGNSEPVDPPFGVSVRILEGDDIIVDDVAVSSDEAGEYYYDWTPEAAGVFTVQFIGHFTENSEDDHYIQEEFFVDLHTTDAFNTLLEDQELIFATDAYPLLVDPDEFTMFYSDATSVEIMELIHRYSTEVLKVFKGREPSLTAYEYIRAAVLCSLSKIYDYGGGDATSLTLGDLKVSHQVYPRNKITRANAANWCELAAALRQDMMRGEAGMKAVVKGTKFPDPMPQRHLRDAYSAKGRRHK